MFEDALEIILRHEGGYVNNPLDPGGETHYGITKAVAEDNGYHGDMRYLPLGLARQIYRTRYWMPIKADRMPWPIAIVTFDAAVNSGVGRASLWLQQCLKVDQDGKIGDETLDAARNADPDEIAQDFTDLRLAYLKSLKTWPTFGKGWERRVRETLKEALA